VSRINPNDVFPARNLPGEAEKWGRSIEEEVKKLREQQEITNQLLLGQNRGSASSLANLGDQLTTALGTQDQINALLSDQVTAATGYASKTNFSQTSASWVTVETSTITVPAGYSKAYVIASASINMFNDSSSIWSVFPGRLVIEGTTFVGGRSNTAGGTTYSTATMSTSATRIVSGITSPTLSVSLSVFGGSVWVANPTNSLEISALAIFTK